MKALNKIFLIVDLGFILYWVITAIKLIPEEYLFSDYHNPLMVNWNWSFLPLDLCISYTGLTSISLKKQGKSSWEKYALISLVLTFCSGLQALAFWTISGDFNLTWWLFNGFLLIYPLFFIPKFIKE